MIGLSAYGSSPCLQNLAAAVCSQVLHDWLTSARLTDARKDWSCMVAGHKSRGWRAQYTSDSAVDPSLTGQIP
jgi:hypothetical protein